MKFVLLIAMLMLPLQAAMAAPADSELAAFAFRPHPGAQLPLALELSDEQGRTVSLAQFFTGKPVVLILEYLRCKTLCGLTVENLVAALDALPLDAGRDFQVMAVSIDPRDAPSDLAAAKAKYLVGYHHPADDAGWHFLAGPEPVVRRIADLIGFPYRYDAELDQYVHPAGFILVAPDGRISRYLLGLGISAADLRSAIADAAQGRAVGLLTRLLLLCHGEGSPPGRYGLAIEAAFIAANLAGAAGGIAVFVAIWRRRHA